MSHPADSVSATAAFSGQRVLVTGAAGFIGMHVARALCEGGVDVVGVDDFDPYYDVALKEARARTLTAHPRFTLKRTDLADAAACATLFRDEVPVAVVHLGAARGSPFAYRAGHLRAQ